MSDRCDVCGKKINNFNVIGYQIEDIVICSNCYDKLGDFRVLKKYENIDDIKIDKEKYIKKSKDLKFPENVIREFERYYDNKIKRIEFDDSYKNKLDNIVISTTRILEGYRIENYLGMVSDQCVLGTGYFTNFNASLADITGTEADIYSKKVNEAREVAQNRAIYKAITLGANAIIDADIEFVFFPNSMVCIIFKGTAVKVTKIES